MHASLKQSTQQAAATVAVESTRQEGSRAAALGQQARARVTQVLGFNGPNKESRTSFYLTPPKFHGTLLPRSRERTPKTPQQRDDHNGHTAVIKRNQKQYKFAFDHFILLHRTVSSRIRNWQPGRAPAKTKERRTNACMPFDLVRLRLLLSR